MNRGNGLLETFSSVVRRKTFPANVPGAPSSYEKTTAQSPFSKLITAWTSVYQNNGMITKLFPLLSTTLASQISNNEIEDTYGVNFTWLDINRYFQDIPQVIKALCEPGKHHIAARKVVKNLPDGPTCLTGEKTYVDVYPCESFALSIVNSDGAGILAHFVRGRNEGFDYRLTGIGKIHCANGDFAKPLVFETSSDMNDYLIKMIEDIKAQSPVTVPHLGPAQVVALARE